MKESYTISESFRLPSKGRLYSGCPERLTLRSMTTEEEMRRLSPTETPYKTLCDVIDACIVEDIPLSTYDMCLGDYQFLLYRLRTVTYGNDYLNGTPCPFCGKYNVDHINLDELTVNELSDDDRIEDLLHVSLPRSKKEITLIPRTPRIMDDIEQDKAGFEKRAPENKSDTSILFKLKHSIKLVDNQHYDSMKLENFIRRLPAMDMNVLDQAISKIDLKVGINPALVVKCKNPECGLEYGSSFRISPEFFRPTV